MALKFRNLDVSPDAPVEQWGFEGLLAAVERGDRTHWHRIAVALDRNPRGKVSAELDEVLAAVENPAMVELFSRVKESALARSEQKERAAVAARMRDCLQRSGLSRAGFAARLGTSQSRLSTYLNGKVVPSAVMMIRAEEAAADRRV